MRVEWCGECVGAAVRDFGLDSRDRWQVEMHSVSAEGCSLLLRSWQVSEELSGGLGLRLKSSVFREMKALG